MAWTIVQDLYSKIDQVATEFAIENMSNILEVATPIVGLALVLSLMIQGLYAMAQPGSEPLSGLLLRFFRYAMVISFAGAGGFFQADLASMALNLPDQLSSNIFMDGQSASADSMGAVIDQAIEAGADLAKQSFENIGLSGEGFASLVISVHIVACTFILCGVGAAFILMAKVLLAITVAFGPVFIFCLLFDNTKQLFTPWVGSLINYILTVVLVSSVFNLMVTFYNNLITNASTNDNVSFVSLILSSGIMLVVTLLIVFKIPSIASSWSSGITATVNVLAASAGARAAKGVASAAGSSVANASGAAARAGSSGMAAASKAGGAVGRAASAALRFARQ